MTHIALIAPSYTVSQSEINLAKGFFEERGMKVSSFVTLGSDLFCSNQDDIRFSDLRSALEDPSIDIIWALRGGYGLTRLVPYLLSLKKPKKEKIFVGFSDGSVLHLFLNQIWNWPSLHAPVALQLFQGTVGAKSLQETLRILEEGLQAYRPLILQPLNAAAHKGEILEGKVVGGNLCLLTCSLGTPLHLNAADKILFFEDLDERGYRLDRMLCHLEQARVLDAAKAVVFGDFMRGEDPDGRSFVEPVIDRFASETNLPVFRLPNVGHGQENFPLPFNTPLAFAIERKKKATLLEAI